MICSLTDNLFLKKQNAVLYKKNVCDGTIMNGKIIDRGISRIVKPYIDRMMKEDTELAPKRCHSMLINGKKIDKKFLPKLYQVIIFVFSLNW